MIEVSTKVRLNKEEKLKALDYHLDKIKQHINFAQVVLEGNLSEDTMEEVEVKLDIINLEMDMVFNALKWDISYGK